jgi:hypothetical protein
VRHLACRKNRKRVAFFHMRERLSHAREILAFGFLAPKGINRNHPLRADIREESVQEEVRHQLDVGPNPRKNRTQNAALHEAKRVIRHEYDSAGRRHRSQVVRRHSHDHAEAIEKASKELLERAMLCTFLAVDVHQFVDGEDPLDGFAHRLEQALAGNQ